MNEYFPVKLFICASRKLEMAVYMQLFSGDDSLLKKRKKKCTEEKGIKQYT